jgi:hypothetical protein
MSAELYLQSIHEPFVENLRKRPLDELAGLIDPSNPASLDAVFDRFRASGGYFRNGYNAGDCMWAMGLSWWGTVSPMLKRGYLSIKCARELVAMIEERPLTRERLAAHYFDNMTNGVEQHPVTGPTHKMIDDVVTAETGQELAPKLPPDFEHIAAYLRKRREQLLAILRKSIELNEPLVCSL